MSNAVTHVTSFLLVPRRFLTCRNAVLRSTELPTEWAKIGHIVNFINQVHWQQTRKNKYNKYKEKRKKNK